MKKDQLSIEWPDRPHAWPPVDRFPRNGYGARVDTLLRTDLVACEHPLIITGYASVEHLLSLFRELFKDAGSPSRSVRLLVGVEPTPSSSPSERPEVEFDRQVADYWLERGVSIQQWGALLHTLELLDSDRIRVRKSGQTRVHAKVYVGHEAITLGSSNFTKPGLTGNVEANVRFTPEEPDRYSEGLDLARNLWSVGMDWQNGFRSLLESLLQSVTWQEALARACAEILEGDWIHQADPIGDTRSPLWPSQEQGVAQALWILENTGAVLIADATGAGKTRTAAHLVRRLVERRFRMGHDRSPFPVLVCPPTVQLGWRSELAKAGTSMETFSHGVLSHPSAYERETLELSLEATQLLAIDEAHNFLNRRSGRSRLVYGNGADHVVLLTATPINRGASDLLSIVDLLGADNFEDDVIQIVSQLGGRGAAKRSLTPRESTRIRHALQHFVVRRTKREFNRLIDQDPARYRNALGDPCRFPHHVARTFERAVSPGDLERAERVAALAGRLKGLINLRRIQVPAPFRHEERLAVRYLEIRLGSARPLAAYHIRSRLRSSRAAVLEHLIGTERAAETLGIRVAKVNQTGDVISSLNEARGSLPMMGPEKLAHLLPPWLTDVDEYAAALEEELSLYDQMRRTVMEMSDDRVLENARYLIELATSHRKLLAFDSHLISLHALKHQLESLGRDDILISTGESNPRQRLKFSGRFSLTSGDTAVIGLCSDALSEGLNLQSASAIVHLDLPTVVRQLEQRIGRVDRMDSPHDRIEVHWPKEPDALRLRADDRLFLRLRSVDDLLGSNVTVPEELDEALPIASSGDLDLEEVIDAVEQASDGSADNLEDAFHQIRRLIEGDEALVPQPVYRALRSSEARVLSSVSTVHSHDAWVFLALGASDRRLPRWLFVDQTEAESPRVEDDLERVATRLRSYLMADPAAAPFGRSAEQLLTAAVDAARDCQRQLLPRRKRRALDEMLGVVQHYLKEVDPADAERLAVLRSLHQLAQASPSQGVDLGRLAGWWLELIRPEWLDYLARPHITRPARIKRLTTELKRKPLATHRLATFRELDLHEVPIEQRVVAAIIGVP